MSSSTTRPASRTAQKFPLRSARPRPVGSEATKPKPAVKSKAPAAPAPPTYADQDNEKGPQDDEPSALVEEEEEEEAAADEPTPVKPAATTKGPVRSKASAFPKPATVDKVYENVPHLSLLTLVSDFKPQPSKPAKVVEICFDTKRLFEMHSIASSLLTPSKAIHKEIPTYNTVFSRLGLSYCLLFKILAAREKCQLLTYDEAKVIKKLRLAHDFEAQVIPSPYLAFLSAIGYHTPTDSRYEMICPRLPFQGRDDDDVALNKTHTYTVTDKNYTTFPHFPTLLHLANIVASGAVEQEVVLADDQPSAGDKDVSVPLFQHGRFLVPIILNYDLKTTRRLYTNNITTSAARAAVLKYATQNVALLHPFTDRLDWIKDVHHHLAIDKIPNSDETKANSPDLLTYFGLKNNVRWISTVMTSLTDEARFFDGAATLGSLGFETGSNVLCLTTLKLENTAVTTKWFPSVHQSDDGNHVTTRMENVSDGMMQIANLTATVTKYESGDAATSYYNDFQSTPITTLDAGRLDPYNGHVRRIIRETQPIEHQFFNHLKSEMLKNVADVIGSL